MWVPIPPSAEAALAGATVLANLSGSPITVARAEDRRLLVRSRRARAARRRTSMRPPARASRPPTCLGRPDDGLRVRRPARRGRALPRRAAPHASPTSTSTGCARSGCGRAPSTTTAARTTSAPPSVPHHRVRAASRRTATSGCAARSTASRSCPTTPSGSRSTATRPTTSRSPASSSGCTRSAQPKVVIGVSGGLDSTHALIVAAKAMDRLGRPRSDILAFTMPGFATGDDDQVATPPGWPRRSASPSRSSTSRAGRRADARRPRPPLRRRASRSTTSPSRTSRPGCAPTTSSGSPTTAAASSLGTGDLSELALGWCTYGVGDQMSHYDVNAGVPKTLIQHLIRWVIDERPVRGADTNEVLARDPRSRRSPPS